MATDRLSVLRLLRISDVRARRFRRRQGSARRTAARAATKRGSSNPTTTCCARTPTISCASRAWTRALRADWPARCSPACRPGRTTSDRPARIQPRGIRHAGIFRDRATVRIRRPRRRRSQGRARATTGARRGAVARHQPSLRGVVCRRPRRVHGRFDRRGLPADGKRRLLAGSRATSSRRCASPRRSTARRTTTCACACSAPWPCCTACSKPCTATARWRRSATPTCTSGTVRRGGW